MYTQSILKAMRAPTSAFTAQSRGFAKATLIGRLGAAPTQREASTGKVYFTYPLAVSRPPKRDAEGKVQLGEDGYPITETDWYTIFNFNERAVDQLPSVEAGSLLAVEMFCPDFITHDIANISTRNQEFEGGQTISQTIFTETSRKTLSKPTKRE